MSAQCRKLNTDVELLKALVKGYPLSWGVVYANPQRERRAFRGLIDGGVVAHLPEETFERRHPKSKKRITIRKPVFSRYLFAGIDMSAGQDWSHVRGCDGVEGLVSLEESGRPYTLSRPEMVSLIDRLNTGERIADGAFIRVGKVLQIIKGPFAGFSMAVTGYKELSETVRGEVTAFGRATAVTASVDDLGEDR